MKLKELEWSTLLFVLLLSASGLVAIYSIEAQHESSAGYFVRQSIWTVIGLIFFMVAFFTPRKVIHNLTYPAYGFGILLLIVPILMKSGGAVSRWIVIGSIGFQPSEFMKVILLLALAKYFADHKRRLSTIKELMTPVAMTLGPTILVLAQPDLG
ncbi:MAG: FtsW/RodA/SpoVE family cell cycle protein, partial [Candidatus Marinimicrobia bacterium]|nr:FtsW/RodA/SpoVE family cell cycle protein [Candidatus Neomarinimicrobiota bacterium]